MFLDEGSLSFAHKEISHKVCGPTRSEKAHYFLVWVYRERFAIEGKKTKKEKERKKAGISTRAFPLESPSNTGIPEILSLVLEVKSANIYS